MILIENKFKCYYYRESEYKELEEKNAKLNSLQSDYNYIDVKRAKEEAENIIRKYDAIFNEMKLSNVNLITKDEFDTAMEALDYLRTGAENLIASYGYEMVGYVYNNSDKIKFDISNLQKIKSGIELKRSNLIDLQKKLYEFESMRKIASELSNRPKDCSIDTCPYIKSAIDADIKYPQSEYLKLLESVNNIENEINNDENMVKNIEEYSNILYQLNNIDRELKSKMKFISKLPVRKDFEFTFMDRMISGDRFTDISDLYIYRDFIEEYNLAKQNLHNYEIEWKMYESKNKIIESILEDVEDLNKKISNLANDIESLNNNINKSETDLLNITKAKDKISLLNSKINDEYLPSVKRENELENIKSSLEDNNIELNKLQNDLGRLSNSLGVIDSDIKKNSAERDSLKHSSQLLLEYKSELELYMNKYSKIEKIKYYASPNTGIQTLFMELYMNKIIAIANDLLSMLFEGEFILQPFIINENEFRIPCIGSGLMHDDISSMSTAQKCMISMILSFSLLYQSSTKYNIIKLDEIDAFLDTNNRGYFITLLDQLMGLLKCEQCFIVSHNTELSSYACDVILLKNPNYIQSGSENIIWSYE